MSSDVIIPAATTSAEPTTTDTVTDTTQKSAAIVLPSTAVQTSHTTSPLSETGTVATASSTIPSTTDGTQPLAVTAWSIEKVKTTILHLEEMFADLMDEAEDEISKKENQDGKFLKKFRGRLLLLPVANKAAHVKFFQGSLKKIREAKNTPEILDILRLHSNYRNYEILSHLITRFCSAPLQESMQKYCKMLEGFEKATTVDVYISAISAGKKLVVAFSEMVMKIAKPHSQCTLYDIRKLKEEIAEAATLESHSVYIESEGVQCVVVVFRFPTSAMGWVLAAMTPNFMTTHLLTEVAVDGECLTIMTEHMDVLVRVV